MIPQRGTEEMTGKMIFFLQFISSYFRKNTIGHDKLSYFEESNNSPISFNQR